MTSIRTALMIAGAAALLGATAASAQTANHADRGAHNSDGSYGLHSHTTMIGDASIEGASYTNREIATAPTVKKDKKALAVAETTAQTAPR